MSVESPDRGGQVVRRGTESGIPWAIMPGALNACLCGYVRIPEGHPWHGVNPFDLDVPAPGGINYGDASGWIGFDTMHGFDHWTEVELLEVGVEPDEEGRYLLGILDELHGKYAGEDAPFGGMFHVTHWTAGMVIALTEQLARDVAAAGVTPAAIEATVEKENVDER
jgi:hypothetical protein